MSDAEPHSLTAREIEALLLRAPGPIAVRADVISDEPLGPGDVLYYRNAAEDLSGPVAISPAEAQSPGGPPDAGDRLTAEERLEQVQAQLAAALLDDPALVPASRSRQAAASPTQAPPAAASCAPLIPADVLGQVEVSVALEVGRTMLRLEDLLGLRDGSLVMFEHQPGTPIDLVANGRLVARAEVLVRDGRFCLRISEVPGQN